jgi:putative transposase
MTYQANCTLTNDLIEQLPSEGFETLPELIRILINTSMQVERQREVSERLSS